MGGEKVEERGVVVAVEIENERERGREEGSRGEQRDEKLSQLKIFLLI